MMSTIKQDVQKLKDDIALQIEKKRGERNGLKEPYYHYTAILDILERLANYQENI